MGRQRERPELSEDLKQILSGEWETIDEHALQQWEIWMKESCGYMRAATVEKMFAQMRIGAQNYERLREEMNAIIKIKLQRLTDEFGESPERIQ